MSRRNVYVPPPELVTLAARLERIIARDWEDLTDSQRLDVCRHLVVCSFYISGLSSEAPAEGSPEGASAAPSGG